MKTLDARSLPSVAQEDLRRKAVKAVLDGETKVEVAKLFGVTRQAVGKWMKAYREGGVKKLKAKRRGRPKGVSAEIQKIHATMIIQMTFRILTSVMSSV